MKGFVYVIHAKGSDFYKIGWAKSGIKTRMGSVQVGCPYELSEVCHWRGSMSDEKKAHKKYFKNWYRGEWFMFSEIEAFELFQYKKEDFKGNCESSNIGRDPHLDHELIKNVVAEMGDF